ncbi:hypothetical protein JCM8097_005336 [Rhodosporidiobolus ruineniae]
MSPTSLANRVALSSAPPSPTQRLRRRFRSLITSLPRRARAILALALLLLAWRYLSPGAVASTSSLGRLSRRPDASKRHLRFASSTPPRPSARLYFASGAVQEVFAPAGGLSETYEAVWEPGVERVEVPLGGRLRWVGQRGESGDIELGKGDDCADGVCEAMRHVRLEQSALIGLRQMRLGDSGAPMTFSVPASQPCSADAVTLVTQFTLSRLDRFERLLHAWDGPVSAAIYLTDESDISKLEQYLGDPTLSPAWSKVALTLVKPDYSVNEEALLIRLRYPINRLRNLALEASPSPYTLVIDVDFVPSPGMHALLSSRAVPLLHHPSSRNSRSPTLLRTALVIPTFALMPAFNGSFPSTLSELEALYSASPPLATLTDANAGHGPTRPSRLFSPSPEALAREPVSSVQPSWSYEACYEPQWEPYYLLARASHPLYDKRFTDQGGDKQAHAALLNALGFEFRVLRDVWVVHPPKTDLKEEEWPAARLVRAGGKPDGSKADVEHLVEADAATAVAAGEAAGDHFNLAAQRDESRFRYFQDFLPELEREWGRNWRWPRGCSARSVGEQAFGRARAQTVFGL